MTNLSLTSAELLQDRFARRVASRLTEASHTLAPDIETRLRFAREQALQRARVARVAANVATQAAPQVVGRGGGTLRLGRGAHGGPSWWVRLGSVVPALVLAAGLVLIHDWQSRSQIEAAAEVDAALLTDSLPPDAYSDPGFIEFLKSPQE